MEGSQATAPEIAVLRQRLIPTGEDDRWDGGELPTAILNLDDHGALERCSLLLDLAAVTCRSLDDTPGARAVALRELLVELLPSELDHPFCGVLRVLAGLEPGTAGRSRDERQRIAGEWLGSPRHPATPRSVRRRIKQRGWPWLLDRLIEREIAARRPPKPTPAAAPRQPATLVLAPDAAGPLVARPDESARLLELVLGAARVVSIRGPAGFGKTTLAQLLCRRPEIRAAFPDGVLWVETGEQCGAARVVQLIADLCFQLQGERPHIADPDQAGFHLAQVLGERRILLVVDNVWSARNLSPFLAGAPGCVRLVTTRNARVCPAGTPQLLLEPMSDRQVEQLVAQQVPGVDAASVRPLAGSCGGWPLLAQTVAGAIRQDILAGASARRAVELAVSDLQTAGPHAFDVWDDDDRRSAMHQAISASMRNLEEQVSIAGGQNLRDAFVSLAVFPSATPVPLRTLSVWWGRQHGWTTGQVRQFCRLLADRSLLGSYRADTDSVMLHDVFRVQLGHEIADRARELHRSLVDAHRQLLPPGRDWRELPTDLRYMWAQLSHHLHEADLHDELVDVLARPGYLVAKAALLGHLALQADLALLRSLAVSGLSRERADGMLSAAFLLSGMARERDIGATLLSVATRSDEQHARDRLVELLHGTGEHFHVSWWTTLSAPGSGHVGAATAVATHGDLVASGGEDGTVRLWDAGAHAERAVCPGHTGWVDVVAISPRHGVIASAGEDGTIRLWDAYSGDARGVLGSHAGRIRTLAFGDPLDVLISGGEDGKVCVWDLPTRALRVRHDCGWRVWSVAVSPDGQRAAVGGEGSVLCLFDIDPWEPVGTVAAHRDWIRSLAFAPTAPLLATGSGDGTVARWSGDERLTPHGRLEAGSRVRSVAFAPGGARLAAGCEDGAVRVWERGDDTPRELRVDVDWIRSVCFGADGRTLVGACEDGVVRLWALAGDAPPVMLGRPAEATWSLAFAAGGTRALAGMADGRVQLRDPASGKAVAEFSTGSGRVWSLAAAGESLPLRVAAACGDGAVRVWEHDGERPRPCFASSLERVWSVALDRTGRLVAAGTGGGSVRVWDVHAGTLAFDSDSGTGRVRSLTFDAHGGRLAWGCSDGSLRTWDRATGRERVRGGDTHHWIRCVALSADGQLLAGGSGPGRIDVWMGDAATPALRLTGHSGRILSLSINADGSRLISGAADGTVRLWSLTDGVQLCQLRLDASLLACAADADAGRVLAATPTQLALLDLCQFA